MTSAPPASYDMTDILRRVHAQVNAPDVWWATTGSPAAYPPSGAAGVPTAQDARYHPSWINATLFAGDPLRVFGRSLGWDPSGTTCLSAAGPLGRAPTTTLSVRGWHHQVRVAAVSASCYEATFDLPPHLQPGASYEATVETAWGAAPAFGLTVLPARAPAAAPAAVLDVTKDFAGDLRRAITHATALPATQRKMVVLDGATYKLQAGLLLPPNTTLVGDGAGLTHLQFTVRQPKPSLGTCGALLPSTDFYRSGCDRSTEHCWTDVHEYDNTTADPADCCAKCRRNPACNGFTHEHDNTRGYLCLLKSCSANGVMTSNSVLHGNAAGGHGADDSQSHCLTTSSNPSTQSALVNKTKAEHYRAGEPAGELRYAGLASAITVAGDTELWNFSLAITASTTIPSFVAIYMPGSARGLRASGLAIAMNQPNVSNAFKLLGTSFEVSGNVANQTGTCLWPGYGPRSDATPFQPSTLLYMEGAADGWVHSNAFFWRCSMMDLDVSDRVIFEDNNIVCTEPGVVPHGNSTYTLSLSLCLGMPCADLANAIGCDLF